MSVVSLYPDPEQIHRLGVSPGRPPASEVGGLPSVEATPRPWGGIGPLDDGLDRVMS